MKSAYDIIIRPVITEQSMEAIEAKKYVFMVAVDANKTEIKKAVSEIFGVKVEKASADTVCMKSVRSHPCCQCRASFSPAQS